jgi:hypothetical protein
MKVYKSTRKYKCPYCDFTAIRGDLVSHVSEEHEEMIPEGYTAARVVFDYLNNVSGGICRSCGKPTEWNEDKWRYDDIHPNEECKKIAREKALKNHVKKYGVKTLLNDPEHQAKMLNNRSISGTYTFSDGQTLTYVGSYEKNFLEFCDQVLHLRANIDIFTIDGKDKELIIPYTYKGERHFWIPDYYIKPFDAMIDLKDGGNNKNNREMPEYRAKQIAKEKAIEKQGKFNYLRLTDNQFGQLLELFLDIKFSLETPKDKKKVHIHEYAGCSCGGHPMDPSDHIYAVSYSDTGYINDGHGIMTNRLSDNIFICDSDELKKVKAKDFLKGKVYTISDIKVENTNIIDRLEHICESHEYFDTFDMKDLIKNFPDSKVIYESDSGTLLKDIIEENVLYSYKQKLDKDIIHTGFPILDKDIREQCNSLLEGYIDLRIMEEVNGYYIENTITGNKSIPVKSINEIQPFLLDLMSTSF